MIDTNTVNYALDKFAATVQKAIPAITDVSEKYIQYAVFEQKMMCLIPIVLFLGFIIFLGLAFYVKKKLYDSDIGFILLVISFACLVFSVPTAINIIPDTIVAINYPEMFAIDKFIRGMK